MIRRAVVEDLPALLAMGKRFHVAAGMDTIPLDEVSTELTLRQLMTAEDGLLLVGDGGMAAALCYPAYFNAAHKQAQELFWWVDEDKRASGLGKELLVAVEDWARGRGAATLTMICLDALEPERVSALYRRAGYTPLERTFLKRL